MASFKLKFRPSSIPGKEGTLYFQVIHHRSVRLIRTDYHIRSDEWNKKKSYVRIVGTAARKAQLQLIIAKVQWDSKRLSRVIKEKELSMMEYTVDEIVTSYQLLPPCQTWFCFIRSMIAQKISLGRKGTAKTYNDALTSFSRFRSGEDISIFLLDGEMINQYEDWLKGRGVKRNSSSCYLRTLRTLYYKAVNAGQTPDRKIFRHVYTGFSQTVKRAIPLESLRAILRLKLSEDSFTAFARDIFILSVYLQGISFVDMAYLKKTDIRNGQLHYSRKKTGQSLSIGWEPVMQQIVDAYAYLTKDSPYLLPIITAEDGTDRQQYMRMEHRVNYHLKKIGKMVGLQMPLTTYSGRHK